ncbi:MAG TPA: DsbA family protein [Solirubrobacteraceae bacterium]|nr:DsbA family protein [Solirubrobacteraceae bacterium]
MGQVIYLHERRSERSRSHIITQPLFFFDVSCPLSYLTAERIERKLGEVEWVPVDGASLRAAEPALARDTSPDDAQLTWLRTRADSCARALRLPLVWPDRFPGGARCAQRASAFACEIGAGAAFALAASRLAFCGGFDLDDPETLAEAAAAAGVPLEECLSAAGEAWRDEELEANSELLRARGISALPAIRIGDQWFEGEAGLLAAGALITGPAPAQRVIAPV